MLDRTFGLIGAYYRGEADAVVANTFVRFNNQWFTSKYEWKYLHILGTWYTNMECTAGKVLRKSIIRILVQPI